MKRFIRAGVLMAIVAATPAAASVDLSDYIGYRIVAAKRIEGYIDRDGKLKDGFEGCDYDRKIIFSDDTYLVCASYNYDYAYRPEAVILSNGSSFVMVVDDETYEMRRS